MKIQITLLSLVALLISLVLVLLWRSPELVLGHGIVSTTIFVSLWGLGLSLLYYAMRHDRQ